MKWLVLIGLALSACAPPTSTGSARAGEPAPDFALQAARGGTYTLADLRGRVVLLAFLNTQAQASAEGDASRSQIVFLRSMAKQFGPNGVQVLIVDAAKLAGGDAPERDALINATYDWHLDAIPLLMDGRGGEVAGRYHVAQLPTTFLIDAEGLIRERWEGFVPAQTLALTLEPLVGPPAHRDP